MRVFEGVWDVVEMDDDAGLETRQEIKHLIVNVAACLQHVSGVDEKEIACLQCIDDVGWHLLDELLDDLHPTHVAVTQQRPQAARVRLDAG